MQFNISVTMDEKELLEAIRFLHNNPENTAQIKEDYFQPNITIDFTQIKSDQERYYHMNGFCALLVTLQNEKVDATY